MFPYLYQSPNLTIGSYGIMLAIAYLTGRHLYITQLNQITSIKINTEALIVSLLVFAVIGAKLMFILKNPQIASLSDLRTLTSGSGFSSQGALIAAIVVMFAFSKLSKVKLSLLLDSAAPAAIIAYALARVGCFLSGDDCWGVDSHLPWAMSFPDGIKPTSVGQTVHPLPLYEIVYSVLIWKYLNYSQNRETKPYFQFFKLLLLWGACRFMIEFISTNPIKILSMTGSQFGALLMFLLATIFFSYHNFTTSEKKPGK